MSSDYSTTPTRISIDLDRVYDEAAGLTKPLDTINDSWTAIMNSWKDVLLSWAGTTPEEVKKFSDDIDAVQKQLFGVFHTDPADSTKTIVDNPGLVETVQSLAKGASLGYAWTDFSVAEMFYQVTINIANMSLPILAPDGTSQTLSPAKGTPAGQLAPNQTKPYMLEYYGQVTDYQNP